MFISDFAIKRPVVTVTTMIALVVFGLFAMFSLDVDEFPDITPPFVSVFVPYPGASPSQVELEVVDRMEEAINSISGVDEMTSTSLDGFAIVNIKFVFTKDADRAAQDVRDAISGIRDKLPPEMKEPVIKKFDPNDQPIVSLVLLSKGMSAPELTMLADPGVTKELRAINGVAEVRVLGGIDRDISVNVRPADLQAYGISVGQIAQALQSQNLAAPVGRVNTPLAEQTIRLQGRIATPDAFKQVVVGQRNGQLIRLEQVADVSDSVIEARTLAFYNGQESVGLDITKSKGSSTSRVATGVKEAVAEIKKHLPAGATLEIVKDAGERVERSVANVEEALIEGALLTVLVVFLFLNSWRSTVITGLALPVSAIAAFIAVKSFGFTLNTMSLLGLSLAIGILIDDAIVVRENIVRHVEMGEDHITASHSGTDEIGLAVAATTFSIVAVFVPVGFMSGIGGQWFKPFALTIACAVIVSLFVSFSLDPMLSAYWPDPELEEGQRRGFISRALDKFNNWFDRQADKYKSVIAWALDHRWWMVLIVVVAFFGSIALQVAFGGGGFAPDSDRSEISVAIETPPGSSLEYTRIKTEQIAASIRSRKEVAYTYTTIGTSNGSGAVDQAGIYVKLVPKAKRNVSQQLLGSELRADLRQFGGVNAYVFNAGFAGNMKQIQKQVLGENEKDRNAAAEKIEAEFRKVKGAVDVGLSTRGEKPELEVVLNRSLMGTMGLSVQQVAQSLYPAFAGLDVGDWVDPTGKTRDVVIRLKPESRENISDLRQIPLTVPSVTTVPGTPTVPSNVPLGQIADISKTLGPTQIDHLNRERVITVGANIEGRSLNEVGADINKRVDTLTLPAGVRVSNGGDVKNQGEVFTSIFGALGLAILLMYLILVIQFGSFLDPLAIMLSLPLSLIGVVIALIITHDTLNIMSMIGIMLLMGIVAKNAILLIDFAKWKHEEGMPLREALIEAGRVRLRPIMMTTLALIAGMIPVALGFGEGADFRSPLGRAVIGGVITSTLLTLLVIPTIYEIISEWREWFFKKIGRKVKSHGIGHHTEGGGAATNPAPASPEL